MGHIYYRVSMSHDRSGKFHHYQIWRAKRGVTAFLAHVVDMIPGTSSDQAHAFCNILLALDKSAT